MRMIYLAIALLVPVSISVGQNAAPVTENTVKAGDGAVEADTEALEAGEGADKPASFWMEKKMKYSESILRGLATADFDLIERSAQQMRALTKVESFVRGRYPKYRENVRRFEQTTFELIRQSERKNLEGVVLAFNHVTANCVRCHQSLRQNANDAKNDTSPERPIDSK